MITQSQPLRSVSLCQRYVSSWPSTWSMTQPQSRSDHVPGKTTTPNFILQHARRKDAGSPRNRRFRGVQKQQLRTSTMTVPDDVEVEVLDHVVRQELAAHLLDAGPRLVLARNVEGDLDVLADADVGDLSKAKRREPLLDGDALRIVDHRFWCDDDSGNHHSFRGLGGNSGLPTRRWYAVR